MVQDKLSNVYLKIYLGTDETTNFHRLDQELSENDGHKKLSLIHI